ncbi:hypothetical protein ACFL3R_00615 [Thermodesulfobacteriota bacterium]
MSDLFTQAWDRLHGQKAEEEEQDPFKAAWNRLHATGVDKPEVVPEAVEEEDPMKALEQSEMPYAEPTALTALPRLAAGAKGFELSGIAGMLGDPSTATEDPFEAEQKFSLKQAAEKVASVGGLAFTGMSKEEEQMVHGLLYPLEKLSKFAKYWGDNAAKVCEVRTTFENGEWKVKKDVGSGWFMGAMVATAIEAIGLGTAYMAGRGAVEIGKDITQAVANADIVRLDTIMRSEKVRDAILAKKLGEPEIPREEFAGREGEWMPETERKVTTTSHKGKQVELRGKALTEKYKPTELRKQEPFEGARSTRPETPEDFKKNQGLADELTEGVTPEAVEGEAPQLLSGKERSSLAKLNEFRKSKGLAPIPEKTVLPDFRSDMDTLKDVGTVLQGKIGMTIGDVKVLREQRKATQRLFDDFNKHKEVAKQMGAKFIDYLKESGLPKDVEATYRNIHKSEEAHPFEPVEQTVTKLVKRAGRHPEQLEWYGKGTEKWIEKIAGKDTTDLALMKQLALFSHASRNKGMLSNAIEYTKIRLAEKMGKTEGVGLVPKATIERVLNAKNIEEMFDIKKTAAGFIEGETKVKNFAQNFVATLRNYPELRAELQSTIDSWMLDYFYPDSPKPMRASGLQEARIQMHMREVEAKLSKKLGRKINPDEAQAALWFEAQGQRGGSKQAPYTMDEAFERMGKEYWDIPKEGEISDPLMEAYVNQRLRDPDTRHILDRYTETPDRTVVDPAFQGEGKAGREWTRQVAEGEIVRPLKMHFYEAGTMPEPAFRRMAKTRAVVDSSKIYNLAEDPKGYRVEHKIGFKPSQEALGAMEKQIIADGFIGMKSGGTTVMFEPTRVFKMYTATLGISPIVSDGMVKALRKTGDTATADRLARYQKLEKAGDVNALHDAVSSEIDKAFDHPLIDVTVNDPAEGRFVGGREYSPDLTVSSGDAIILKGAVAKFLKRNRQYEGVISDFEGTGGARPKGIPKQQAPTVSIKFPTELTQKDLAKVSAIMDANGIGGSKFVPETNTFVVHHLRKYVPTEGAFYKNIANSLREIRGAYGEDVGAGTAWFKHDVLSHDWAKDPKGTTYDRIIARGETRSRKLGLSARPKVVQGGARGARGVFSEQPSFYKYTTKSPERGAGVTTSFLGTQQIYESLKGMGKGVKSVAVGAAKRLTGTETAQAKKLGARVMEMIFQKTANVGKAALKSAHFRWQISHDLTKLQREAVSLLVLEKKIPDVKAFLEKMERPELLELVKSPDKKLQYKAQMVSRYLEEAHKYLKDNYKDDIGYVKNYLTMLFEGIPKGKGTREFRHFLQKNPFAEKRTIPSLWIAVMKAGFNPKERGKKYTPTIDIDKILFAYDNNKIQSVHNKLFLDELKLLRDEDGLPVTTLGQKQFKGKAPFDWEPVNHPAFPQQSALFHPDIANEVNIIFGRRMALKVNGIDMVHAIETVNAFAKKGRLSLSIFHHIALLEAAASSGTLLRTAKILTRGYNPIKIYEAVKKGDFSIYKKMPEAADAMDAGLILGAPSDVYRGQIEASLQSVENFTKGMVGVHQAAKFVRRGNQLWDAGLWDELHNTIKLEAYESLVFKGLKDAKKSMKRSLTPKEIVGVKRGMASIVNDSFGGQNWDIKKIMGQPAMRQFMQLLLLAPDWTISTIKQGTAPFRGAAQYAKGRIKDLPVDVAVGKAVMTRGTWFWMRAALYYNVIAQSLNYYNTKKEYGKGRFTWGNPIGKRLHVMMGRNDDVERSERYVRFGKQFLEIPEYALHFMDKIGSKASPFLQEVAKQWTGHTLGSGFPTRWADVEGWALKERGLSIAESFIPYSLRPYIEDRPHPFLLTFPSSKGMTRFKTIKLFKQSMEEAREVTTQKGKQKIMDRLRFVYISALQNNLEAEDLFKRAKASVKSDITYDNKKLARELYTEIRYLWKDKKNLKAAQDLVKAYKKQGILTRGVMDQMNRLYKERHRVETAKKKFGIGR